MAKMIKIVLLCLVCFGTASAFSQESSGPTGANLAKKCEAFVQEKMNDDAAMCYFLVEMYVDGWNIGVGKGVLGALSSEAKRRSEPYPSGGLLKRQRAVTEKQVCGVSKSFKENPQLFLGKFVAYVAKHPASQKESASVALMDYINEMYCDFPPRKRQ